MMSSVLLWNSWIPEALKPFARHHPTDTGNAGIQAVPYLTTLLKEKASPSEVRPSKRT